MREAFRRDLAALERHLSGATSAYISRLSRSQRLEMISALGQKLAAEARSKDGQIGCRASFNPDDTKAGA